MSKLYRSLLWSGLVAAGVAACGDDVTVTPPAPPVLGVHSISVGPNPATIQVGTTLQMTASVNADPGIVTTVTWRSTNTAVATVGQTTGLVTAVAAGTVAVEACSTFNTAVCGNATVVVQTTPVLNPTVTQVSVAPSAATLSKPQTGSVTLQLSAAVVGTNNPSQTVTWSVVGSPAGASISSSGLLTITSAIAALTVNVSACSTVAGFTAVCGFSTVTIGAITPATVSLSAVTWIAPTGPAVCTPGPGPATPVVLTNVRCQIEVTANVNAGDIQLSRIDVVMTNTCTVPPNTAANCVTGSANARVMASQTFPGTVAANGEGANISAPVDITMSISTTQVRSPSSSSSNLVPAIFNGNATIQLVLYSAAGAQVASTTPTPVVMNNVDAVTYPTSLTNTTNTPAGGFTTGGVTFFTGTQTVTGSQYISFSQTTPNSSTATVNPSTGLTGTLCGTSSLTVSGTPTTGITLGGVFACAGVQGSNTVSNTVPPAFGYAVATGPDGTPITPPTFYSTVGSAFQLPASATFAASLESRWNLLLQNGLPVPLPTLLTAVGVDNAAPVITISTVAFNPAFDFWWVNASYVFAANLSATDVGGSGVTSGALVAHDYLPGTFVPLSAGCTAVVKVTGADYAETLISSSFPDADRICAFATDNVGNVTVSGPSNFFGVDKVSPLARLIFATPPGVNPVGFYTTPNVSATPNTSKYQIAAALANMPWGLEGEDTRSGFNQNVVAGDDAAHQSLIRLWPAAVSNTGDAACTLSDQLLTTLSDGWKRTNISAPPQDALDCGQGVGYYFYNGWVLDRAGNQSLPIVRNFVFDPGAPNMTGIGFASAFYTPGAPAPFSFSANDDLNVVSATLGFAMSGMPFPSVGVQYPQCCLSSGSTPPAGFGITLTGPGWGVVWPTTKAQLAPFINGAVAQVDFFLFRTDESCRFNGDPYTSCDVTTNGTGSKPTVAADYNQNLYGPPLPVVLTNQQKLPQAVLANIADVVGRESVTGIFATMLNTQFSPSTGLAAPWGPAGSGADIATWTGSIVGTTAVAVHRTQTSNGVTYFDDASLWRFNTTVNQWDFCDTMTPPTVPTIDNGSFRTWTYTKALPTLGGCAQLTGPWKAMGRKGGAGLFTVAF